MFREIILLFILLFSKLTQAADLTINIENISQTKSPIICALFDSKDGFPMKAKLAKLTVNAEFSEGKAICVFKDVPAKRIAISVVEDLNSNGRVDTTFIGFPKEPWAVSNNIAAHNFGPPTFEEAATDSASVNNINIRLIKP